MIELSHVALRKSSYCQGSEGVCVLTGYDPLTREVVLADSKNLQQGVLRFPQQRFELFWAAARRGVFDLRMLTAESRTADPELQDGVAVRLIDGSTPFIGVSQLASPDGLELLFFPAEWRTYLAGICDFGDHKPSRMVRERHLDMATATELPHAG